MSDSSSTSSQTAHSAAGEFLVAIIARLEPLQLDFNRAGWDASVSGAEADASRRVGFDTQLRSLLLDAPSLRAARTDRKSTRLNSSHG